MASPDTATSPRKAPRQARAQATYDAILEAAARILETDGLGALNTNAVAARAGISVGSLYQYFPSKEAILSELLLRERQRLCVDLEVVRAGSETLDIGEAVRAFLSSAVAHQLQRPALARALEYVEALLPLDAQTRATNEEIAAILTRFLRSRGVARPELAARDIAAMTRGLIDARRLARMPAGSHLVNVARGGHVVENDLLAALDSGHLASATLDVTATEPLAPGHRFWHHPRIVLTPHVAADSTPETMAPILADSLRRHAGGLPPRDPVLRDRGY